LSKSPLIGFYLQQRGRKLAPGEKRKVFFSEEKKQKTFASLSRFYPEARAQEAKVFWFFFPKKNSFLATVFAPTATPARFDPAKA
jgi:hypothetical protein